MELRMVIIWRAITKPVAKFQCKNSGETSSNAYFPHQEVGRLVGRLVVGRDVGRDVVGCLVVGGEVVVGEFVGFKVGPIQPRSVILSCCGFLCSFDSAISYKTLELSDLAMVSSTSSLVE